MAGPIQLTTELHRELQQKASNVVALAQALEALYNIDGEVNEELIGLLQDQAVGIRDMLDPPTVEPPF